jgi:hypothetical protein
MPSRPREALPEGRTRPGRRLRRLAAAAAPLLVVGSACLGGWLGALAGLWVGRAVGFLRLSFSTGLTGGTLAGLVLGGIAALAARGAPRASAPRRRAEQPRVERQREQVR